MCWVRAPTSASAWPLPVGLTCVAAAVNVGHSDIAPAQVATDGVWMTRIIGTNDGKIFMAGNDGFLYHLAYGQSQVRSARCARVIESGGPSPESEAMR